MAIGGDTQLYAIYKRHSIDIKCVKIKEYNECNINIRQVNSQGEPREENGNLRLSKV